MAISTEHLGTQVHCPHCMEIVQAPPPASAGPEPKEIKGADSREGESIFAAPSDEDIFGGSPKAQVEMPDPPPLPAPMHLPPLQEEAFPPSPFRPGSPSP